MPLTSARKAEAAILMSEKIDFRAKNIVKESKYQEHITIKEVY